MWNTLHYCFHYPRVVILLFLLFIFFSFIAINMAVSWIIFFSILNGACEAGSWSTIRIIFYNSFEDVWTIGYEAWITPLYLYVYKCICIFYFLHVYLFMCELRFCCDKKIYDKMNNHLSYWFSDICRDKWKSSKYIITLTRYYHVLYFYNMKNTV